MKKLLVLMTVLVAVLGFNAGAFAAWGDPICTSCSEEVGKSGIIECELRNIPCPEEQQPCYAFDYDDGYGYCEGNELPCKLIFNICNCEDPADFEEGQTIGIKMTILVDGVAGENGAYWSDGASADVAFSMYASAEDACDGTVQDLSFGPGKFFDSDGVEVTTLIGDTTCTVPNVNRAVVILTNIDAGYQITAADELNKLSHWWIDVAPIRTDPAVVQAGQVISILVQLLNQESGGICADCTPVCECVVDVAIVCCEVPGETYCMYFPYVLPGSTSWFTGIVLTNMSPVAPADMVATFTLTDYTGASFTYTKNDFTSVVWSSWLNSMLGEFSGTPAVGPAYLKVNTNFNVDGYQFMTDGVFGAGTLPRCCSGYCVSGS